jgi:type I restriction enzyme S subunit
MNEWRELPLGEITADGAGIADGPFGSSLPASLYKIHGVPVIRGSNLSLGKVRFNADEFVYVDEATANTLLRSNCIPNDIVFTKKGTIGQAGLVPDSLPHKRFLLSSNQMRLRVNSDLADAVFVYYFVSQPDSRETIVRNSSESGVPKINITYLKTFPILLPPLPEQRAIASVLSSLDDKIDLLHRQNKTLEAMAETLFRQWFVEEAGEDWEEGTLTDEFDFTMGQSPPGDSFNELGLGTPMFQGNADFGFRFPTPRVFTSAPTRFAEPLDCLISVRAPVGAQNMASSRCCIGRGLATFRLKHNSQFHTYTFFKLRSLMDEFKQFNSEGTVFGSISKSDIQQMKTTIPPITIINKFESEVGRVNQKIIINCNQIRTLEKLRDTLLPKLMSGEVRVAYD